ncbi:MAG: PilW family protein [Gammaproteobacteria bacterium]
MRQKHNHPQAGLSLIELMVALVVGLILLAGVLAIFAASNRTNSATGAESQLQENGRFALDFIRTSTRMAGNVGCTNLNLSNSLLTTPSANPVLPDISYDFTNAVEGFEADGTAGTAPGNTYDDVESPVPGGTWTPTLDNYLTTAPFKVMPGTDVLVIHSAQGLPATVTVIVNNAAAFTVNAVPAGITVGSLAVITDCVKATTFQVTGTGGGVIGHAAGPPPTPGDAVGAFFPNAQYDVGSQMLAMQTTVFYIGQGADKGPALMQATLPVAGPPLTSQELVPDVENMQILYGVDTTGAQMPSEYDTADVVNSTGNWGNVVSVRVALLLRSETGAAPLPANAPQFNLLGTKINAPKDTRLRRVFTATIGLRNLLP